MRKYENLSLEGLLIGNYLSLYEASSKLKMSRICLTINPSGRVNSRYHKMDILASLLRSVDKEPDKQSLVLSNRF